MAKKKILWHSCWSKTQTGFGKHAKTVLSHLYKTNKYEIIEYTTAPRKWNDPKCKVMPWKCHGCLPDNDYEIQQLFSDQNRARPIQYGAYYIDRAIKEFKPDVYIGVEDIWGFNGYWDRPWWNKIPCAIWTTLDSLPIIDIAENNAKKIKNYWVWTDFAREALHDLGHTHVKTVHGAIDNSKFHPVSEDTRKAVRKKANIDEDTLVFGFVFRNQLRKLVGTLIQGFAKFKKSNPKTKAKLLLHTFYDEPMGWKIPKFIKEYGVDNEDVLTTYICRACKQVQIKPYIGQGLNCPVCGAEKAQNNPQVDLGCEDEDLNFIYNAMDAYIHPMTSGGLEIPVLEAALAGLPIATVPYSCGTEYTKNEDVYALKYIEYREHGSQFIKSQPSPDSIARFMEKMNKLGRAKRKELGGRIRNWAKKEFNNEDVFEFLENWLDSIPENNYNYSFERESRDEKYPLKNIENNVEWLIDLYSGCLKMEENENSDGLKYWMSSLDRGATRKQIHDYFIQTAKKENLENTKVDIKEIFKDTGKKKLAFIMPQSIGDCFISTSVIKSMAKVYPIDKWDYYVCTKPEFFEMFKHLEEVKDLVPYHPDMDNYRWWEGDHVNDGVVDIAFQPYIATQRISSYTHNGLDIDNLQVIFSKNDQKNIITNVLEEKNKGKENNS